MDASFPAPYTARPATLDDAEAVAALLNLTAVGFVGEPSTTPENLCSEWQAPGYDLAALSMIAEEKYGWLSAGSFASGDERSAHVALAPAECPVSATCVGSPPNLEMFLLTHFSA